MVRNKIIILFFIFNSLFSIDVELKVLRKRPFLNFKAESGIIVKKGIFKKKYKELKITKNSKVKNLQIESKDKNEIIEITSDIPTKYYYGKLIINTIDNTINFVGIGNISAFIVEDSIRKTMVSQNGIIGEFLLKIKENTYNFNDNSLFVFHSDGISASWNLKDYPGVEYKDPAIIAGILYRDYTRGNDDLTIVVGKKRKR